jgi:hypothetical protein
MTVPQLMRSGYKRKANDDYKTIDPRCVYALLQHCHPSGGVVDVCAPSGSGIVTTLRECGYQADGIADAFADDVVARWIITNPPYTRDLVDRILWRQIERVGKGEVYGFAALMRWGFDHAVSRVNMFARNSFYYGQIKTMFRPIWVKRKKGDKQPFHPFIWHIWVHDNVGQPVVMWADGEKP